MSCVCFWCDYKVIKCTVFHLCECICGCSMVQPTESFVTYIKYVSPVWVRVCLFSASIIESFVAHITSHHQCECDCVFRLSSRPKALLHTSQLYGVWPVCVRQCVFRWSSWLKALLHTSHMYGVLPVCVCLDGSADRKLCYIHQGCMVSYQCGFVCVCLECTDNWKLCYIRRICTVSDQCVCNCVCVSLDCPAHWKLSCIHHKRMVC